MQQVFPAPTPSAFDPDFLPIFLSVHDRGMAKGTIGQYVIQCYCREVGGGSLGDQGLWNETLLLEGPFTHLTRQQSSLGKIAFLPQGHTYVHANKQEGVGTHREPEEYSPLGREGERPRTQVGTQRFSSYLWCLNLL